MNKSLLVPCFLLLSVVGACKRDSVGGITLGETLVIHQSYAENRRMCAAVEDVLGGEAPATRGHGGGLGELLKTSCDGEGSYQLGALLVDLAEKVGDEEFAGQACALEPSEKAHLAGLLAAGLDYGAGDRGDAYVQWMSGRFLPRTRRMVGDGKGVDGPQYHLMDLDADGDWDSVSFAFDRRMIPSDYRMRLFRRTCAGMEDAGEVFSQDSAIGLSCIYPADRKQAILWTHFPQWGSNQGGTYLIGYQLGVDTGPKVVAQLPLYHDVWTEYEGSAPGDPYVVHSIELQQATVEEGFIDLLVRYHMMRGKTPEAYEAGQLEAEVDTLLMIRQEWDAVREQYSSRLFPMEVVVDAAAYAEYLPGLGRH